jgi:hypothetical protein
VSLNETLIADSVHVVSVGLAGNVGPFVSWAWVIPKVNSDAGMTLVSPNWKPCMFDEDELLDSFTGSSDLPIPKLNFMAGFDSKPGLALWHATQFNASLLFCNMQSGQSHDPGGFLNLSPNPSASVDSEDGVGVDLAANTGLSVSQA